MEDKDKVTLHKHDTQHYGRRAKKAEDSLNISYGFNTIIMHLWHCISEDLKAVTNHNLVLCRRGDAAVVKVIPLSIHFILAISRVC